MKKKRISALMLAASFLLLFSACFAPSEKEETVTVVATLFPQYDFAKAIAGEYAQVSMLLPVGTEAHGFDPTPSDMLLLNRADLLLYTGDAMEPWVKTLTADMKIPVKVDLSEAADLLPNEEEEHEDHHHGGVDPHIWTSPKIAMAMAEQIKEALVSIDPTHKAEYENNAAVLIEELSSLDTDFKNLIDHANRKEIVFCGRFALQYFCTEYGLSHFSPYASCEEEAEPSPVALAQTIDKVREGQIPVVYFEELSDPKTAQFVAEQTGAVPLLFHSCHNVTKEEWDQGVTYVSLMRQNYENLQRGLNE